MKFLVRINEGSYYPSPWYGVAWRDWDTNMTVCAPIPFNQILYQLRRVWHWLKLVHGGDVVEQLVMDADRRGLARGSQGRIEAVAAARVEAYDAGFRDGQRAMAKRIEDDVMVHFMKKAAAE